MNNRKASHLPKVIYFNRDFPSQEPPQDLIVNFKSLNLFNNLSIEKAIARHAICDYYNSSYAPMVPFRPSEVMCAGISTLDIVLKVALKRAKNILVATPYDTGLGGYQMTQLFTESVYGGDVIALPTIAPDFKLDAKILAETLQDTPDVCALVLNATNIRMSNEELENIIYVLKQYPNLLLVLDHRNAYLQPTIKTLLINIPELRKRLIIITSLSKEFALSNSPIRKPIIEVLAVGNALLLNEIEDLYHRNYFVPDVTAHVLVAIHFKGKCTLFGEFIENEKHKIWLKDSRKIYEDRKTALIAKLKNLKLSIFSTAYEPFIFVDMRFLLGQNLLSKTTSDKKNETDVFQNDEDIAVYFFHTAGVNCLPGSALKIHKDRGILAFSYMLNRNDLRRGMNLFEQALINIPAYKSKLDQLITAEKINALYALAHTSKKQSSKELLACLETFTQTEARSVVCSGQTLLMETVWTKSAPYILLALVERGANINAVNKEGNNLIHLAAKFNRSAYLEVLLTYNTSAILNQVNYAGQTPLDVAKFYDSREAYRTLSKSGAKCANHQLKTFLSRNLMHADGNLQHPFLKNRYLFFYQDKIDASESGDELRNTYSISKAN